MSVTRERVGSGVKFPDDPDKRFNIVCSSLMNAETKCVAMGLLDEDPKTLSDAYIDFLEVTKGAWMTYQGISFLRGYYQNNWADSGFVVRTTGRSTKITKKGRSEADAYYATDAAIKFAQPIAAFLLDSTVLTPMSLSALGSSKKGGGANGIINRLGVLDMLNREERATDLEISRNFGEQIWLTNLSLGMLTGANLVDFKPRGGGISYVLDLEDRNDVNVGDNLGESVLEMAFRLKRVNASFVAKLLKERFYKLTPSELEDQVNGVLLRLHEQGVFKREDDKNLKKGEAVILEGGRNFLDQVISPIKSALAGEDSLLATWSEIDWRKSAARGVRKYLAY